MKRLTWCCGLLCIYRRFLLTTAHVRRVIIRFEKGKKKLFLFFLLLIFYWNFLLLLLDSRRTCVPNVVNLELFNLAGSGAPGSRHSSEWQPAASDIDFPLFLLFSYSSSSSSLFFFWVPGKRVQSIQSISRTRPKRWKGSSLTAQMRLMITE